MKRIILGLALLGYFGAAYGADWVKIGSGGGEAAWAMRAQGAGEIWEKLEYSSPHEVGTLEYNKEVSLDEINCSAGSDTTLQDTFYLNGAVTSAGPGNGQTIYGEPGTFEAAMINAACGTK